MEPASALEDCVIETLRQRAARARIIPDPTDLPAMHVGLVTDATLKQAKNADGRVARTLTMRVPTDPRVLYWNGQVLGRERKQSPVFWLQKVYELAEKGEARIATPENPLLTPSAGTIAVYHNDKGQVQYVSLCQKDDRAPRDPLVRVPRNGFPRTEEDWWTMDHMFREGWEEGPLITRDYKLIVPSDRRGIGSLYTAVDMLAQKAGLKLKGTQEATVVYEDGLDTLEIYRGNEATPRLTMKGVLSWTPETGLNFIKVMRVEYPISGLYVLDAETLPNGMPLRRDQCVLDLYKIQGKQFGDEIEEDVHRFRDGKVTVTHRRDKFLTDKVPRSVLGQIYVGDKPVYPVDWMVESEAFLSNPKTMKAYNGALQWSALEREMKCGK